MEVSLPIAESRPHDTAASSAATDPVPCDHLVFFQHGLDGNTENWAKFVEKLKTKYRDDVYVHLGIANEEPGSTWEGIEKAGERTVFEIIKVHEVLFQSRRIKLTAVGHSLGGLLLRYAFGRLHEDGKLHKMFDLQVFYTFASPHIGGVRRRESGLFNAIASFVMSKILDKVGQQLLLEDKDSRYGDRPLLLAMSDQKLPFYQAYASFPRRVLYSNVLNDVSVPYCTSAISHINPYLHSNDFKCYNEYPHIIETQKTSPNVVDHKDHSGAAAAKNSADQLDRQMELDISASTPHGKLLKEILMNLQTLSYDRFACYFPDIPGMAHFLILNQPAILPGEDVPQHFVDNFAL